MRPREPTDDPSPPPGEPSWSGSLATLRNVAWPPALAEEWPGALANADLLQQAEKRWAGKVTSRTSHHDLLFTLPNDTFPWSTAVLVSYHEGLFEFQLRRDELLIKTDHATTEDAPGVLDAFLLELTTSSGRHEPTA